MHDTSGSPPGGSDKDPPDARHTHRQRALMAGKVVVNKGMSTFDVTVRDLSEAGARLLLKDPLNLPDSFELIIANKTAGTSKRHTCEKRWQKAGLVGVRFL
jgi:hypothetical protein